MAKKAQPAPAPPKPYEVLAMRLQRAINTPAAQKLGFGEQWNQKPT